MALREELNHDGNEYAQAIDKFQTYRKIAQRPVAVQQRFHSVFHGIVVFAKHLEHQNVHRLGQ
ncbi:Uncharacterised protein [Salmonella enterica subsp. enterica serovar Bovismorbificans]|nr:Uncharacterised protein [Salmonella enterica subsp. enterica serovar Bovismorbificans]